MSTNSKQTVFSGVQPTGNLHLGNYLGAIKNFVELQKKMECIYWASHYLKKCDDKKFTKSCLYTNNYILFAIHFY